MKNKKNERSKRINVQVTPEEFAFIKNESHKRGSTVASFIRSAVYRVVSLESRTGQS